MNEIQFLLYNTPDENIKVNVIVKDETLWLTQKAMAELFDVNSQAITKHLKNIFDEGELLKEATCSKMEQVQKEGERLVNVMWNFTITMLLFLSAIVLIRKKQQSSVFGQPGY